MSLVTELQFSCPEEWNQCLSVLFCLSLVFKSCGCLTLILAWPGETPRRRLVRLAELWQCLCVDVGCPWAASLELRMAWLMEVVRSPSDLSFKISSSQVCEGSNFYPLSKSLRVILQKASDFSLFLLIKHKAFFVSWCSVDTWAAFPRIMQTSVLIVLLTLVDEEWYTAFLCVSDLSGWRLWNYQ